MQCCYRDRIDVLISILHVTNCNEVRQADILKRANIPYSLFKEYLFFLHQYGLIEIRHMQSTSQRTFRTTAKGICFLNICDKMRAICEISSPWNKPDNIECPAYADST
jgi:predicted transcriptional regulator